MVIKPEKLHILLIRAVISETGIFTENAISLEFWDYRFGMMNAMLNKLSAKWMTILI